MASERDVVGGLKEDQYAFTVEVGNIKFDVYHTICRRKLATVSVAIVEGILAVGSFAAGHQSEDQVMNDLRISVVELHEKLSKRN